MGVLVSDAPSLLPSQSPSLCPVLFLVFGLVHFDISSLHLFVEELFFVLVAAAHQCWRKYEC